MITTSTNSLDASRSSPRAWWTSRNSSGPYLRRHARHDPPPTPAQSEPLIFHQMTRHYMTADFHGVKYRRRTTSRPGQSLTIQNIDTLAHCSTKTTNSFGDLGSPVAVLEHHSVGGDSSVLPRPIAPSRSRASFGIDISPQPDDVPGQDHHRSRKRSSILENKHHLEAARAVAVGPEEHATRSGASCRTPASPSCR